MPTFIGSGIKGYREMTEGITDKNYAPMFYGTDQLKGTPTEFAMRVLSFNPERTSGIREKVWREENVRMEYQKERTNILEHFNQLYVDITKASNNDFADLYRRIEDYNDLVAGTNPKYQIPYITRQWLVTGLKRSQKPNKYEKARTVD